MAVSDTEHNGVGSQVRDAEVQARRIAELEALLREAGHALFNPDQETRWACRVRIRTALTGKP
jgi:hypothetical protein